VLKSPRITLLVSTKLVKLVVIYILNYNSTYYSKIAKSKVKINIKTKNVMISNVNN